VDLACSAFSGLLGYDVLDLAIYDGVDGFGILGKYPKPQTSPYGHIMPFSLGVIIFLIDVYIYNRFRWVFKKNI